MSSQRVTDPERFSLLEREAPDLCADRVDYTLRECLDWIAPEIVHGCLENLINHNGQIIFRNKGPAKEFAYAYAKCQEEHWGSPEYCVRFSLLAEALKIALNNNMLLENAFYTMSDSDIIAKLKASRNPQIEGIFSILQSKKLNLVREESNPEHDINPKFRYVDPHYKSNGNVYRLSETDGEYSMHLRKQREKHSRGIRVNLINP